MSKIAFCMVARDQMHTATALDLSAAMLCTMRAGHTVAMIPVIGTGIAGQRQSAVKEALAQGAEWLMWIDSDMRFPPDACLRLLKHRRDIVGCNYATREWPPLPTARKISDDKKVWSSVYTPDGKTGLEVVNGLGFGCILVAAKVFTRIKENKELWQNGKPPPWFNWLYSTVNEKQLGEDLFFAQLAEQSGFQIHLDHDLSREILHIGSWEFSLAQVEACKAKYEDAA